MPQAVKAAQSTFSHRAQHTPASPNHEQWDQRDEQWSANATGSAHSPSSDAYTHNRNVSDGSLQRTPPKSMGSFSRKPVPSMLQQPHGPELRLHGAPVSPVNISPARQGIMEPERGSISYSVSGDDESRQSMQTPDSGWRVGDSNGSMPIRNKASNGKMEQQASYHDGHSRDSSSAYTTPRIDEHDEDHDGHNAHMLHYSAFEDLSKKRASAGRDRNSQMTTHSAGSGSSSSSQHGRSTSQQQLGVPRTSVPRPSSSYALGAELRGRTLSPLSANGSDSQSAYGRDLSSSRRSPLARPTSYVDLLNNLPYSEQIAPGGPLNNASLQSVVGNAASLLDTKKTLDMYRANVKKTTDAAVQYEFAIFMINASRDLTPEDGVDPAELTNEAKHILQRLADRAYPFAQYYLADGFSSGLFNKGKPDLDKSFPLFVAASKHGHAEAGYRAALCYEFGWGTTKAYPKAVQFYRNSASKNHPGAAARLGLACISGDMGLKDKYREGVKWLKRAQESADFQYNTGPYELGLMHLTGHGEVIFKDEAYAAQLLTQSAELGHVQANFMMGRAYENGLYGCPRDAALSVHFYNGAATRGHVEGMMALCAWYMVGAEPVLEKDEGEAYAWAKQAADTGEFFGCAVMRGLDTD